MSEFYFWVGVCEFSLNIGVKFIGLKRLNNCPLVLEQSYQKSLTSKRHIHYPVSIQQYHLCCFPNWFQRPKKVKWYLSIGDGGAPRCQYKRSSVVSVAPGLHRPGWRQKIPFTPHIFLADSETKTNLHLFIGDGGAPRCQYKRRSVVSNGSNKRSIASPPSPDFSTYWCTSKLNANNQTKASVKKTSKVFKGQI